MDDQTSESSTVAKKSSMNPMAIAGISIVVVLAGLGIYIAHQSSKAPATQQVMHAAIAPTSMPTAMPSAMATAAATASPTAAMQAQTITVEGGNYYFKPNKITVKKGATVTIAFTNAGGFHDFVLDGYNVKTAIIGSGKSQSVTFTADKAGTFAFYCSVGNHRQMGMAGTLTVE